MPVYLSNFRKTPIVIVLSLSPSDLPINTPFQNINGRIFSSSQALLALPVLTLVASNSCPLYKFYPLSEM